MNANFACASSDFSNFNDSEARIFLRFVLEPELLAAPILSVQLQATVGPQSSDASSTGGFVWEVAPFEPADLTVAQPALVGEGPLAPSPGAVAVGETTTWSLPVKVIDGELLTLAILNDTADGVDYYGHESVYAPRLLIECAQ